MYMENELVSVIMPAYKAADYIGKSIEGVLNQSYQQIELLCVDDRSPDHTFDVIKDWGSRDTRVRPLQVDVNGGPAAARNYALEHARGRFVAFCDADDIWLPAKLEKQLTVMRDQGAGMSFTGYRRISGIDSEVGRVIAVPLTVTYRELLGNTVILTSTVLVDRACSGDFRMRKTFYDDFVLWLELLRCGVKAVGVNEDLARYRILPNSYSRNKGVSAIQVWKTFRDVEKLSVVASGVNFVRYAWNGWQKYRRF